MPRANSPRWSTTRELFVSRRIVPDHQIQMRVVGGATSVERRQGVVEQASRLDQSGIALCSITELDHRGVKKGAGPILFGTANALGWLAKWGGVACGGDGVLKWGAIGVHWLASERRGGPDIALDVWVTKEQEGLNGERLHRNFLLFNDLDAQSGVWATSP